jgi:DNA-binding MarR family transcriptional regulator
MALWLLSPLHKATRQITVYLEGLTASHGVSPGEGHLLTYLASYGPCPISELARVFGHSASTLTGMLDRLAAAGLLVRRSNEHDRRSFLIELTPAGRAVATSLTEELTRLEGAVAQRVSAEEMAGFAAVMRAVGVVTRVVLRGGEVSPTEEGAAGRRGS